MAEWRYRLNQAPKPTVDGSGVVKHDLTAVGVPDVGDPFDVPSHHKDFCLPGDELTVVMDMPDSAGAERQAKNKAYKNLLKANETTQPIPTQWPPQSDWSEEGLEQYTIDYAAAQVEHDVANALSAAEATRADEYITVTLGQEYPVEFALNW